MKETDLYLPVKELLYQKIGCEAVYAEIMNVDILGKQAGILGNLIAEMKA